MIPQEVGSLQATGRQALRSKVLPWFATRFTALSNDPHQRDASNSYLHQRAGVDDVGDVLVTLKGKRFHHLCRFDTKVVIC